MPPQEKQWQHSEFRTTENANASKEKIIVGRCEIYEVGLERFIRRCTKELNLNMSNNVLFNLNDRGILHKWNDVFKVEKTYSKCLGISKRIYQCHGYTHKVEQRLVYFILEEENKRCWNFLPGFHFHVMVLCCYDAKGTLTKVDVRYDQMSFFLHCIGMMRIHTWFVGSVLTPIACVWMRAFTAFGFVNPLTFIAQILFLTLLLYRCTCE